MRYIAISNRNNITGDVITIGLNPNDPVPIKLLDMVVEVNQPATLTIELGGTVPSGGSTPIVPTPLSIEDIASAVQCWSNSDSSGGVPASIAMSIPAGGPIPVELKYLQLCGRGTDRMVTIRLSHQLGNSKIALYFEE